MTHAADPIGIGDNRFFLNNTIFNFDKKMAIREFTMNAVEAEHDVTHGEKYRRIIFNAINVWFQDATLPGGWYCFPAKKLAIMNSGRGMDPTQLEYITNFAASSKPMGLDDEMNRGEGAKISSLKHNMLGLRYVSCKDGVLTEALLYWNEELQCFAKDTNINPLTGLPAPAWNLDWSVLHPEEKERYSTFKGADFTEVTLFGNNETDETWRNPYNEEGFFEQQSVPYELFGRCYDLKTKTADGADLPIKIKFGDDFRAGGSALGRSFYTLGHILTKLQHQFHKIETVTLESGVQIEYIDAKMDSSRRTCYNTNSLGRNGSRIALLHNDEMFDALEFQSWAAKAADYGLAGVGHHVSVLIRLPKGYAKQDRTRADLSRNGQGLTVVSFQQAVIRNRPKWLLAMVESKFQNVDSTKSTQEKLQRIAEDLARNSRNRVNGGDTSVVKTKLEDGGQGRSGDHTGTGVSPTASPTTKTPHKGPPRKRHVPASNQTTNVSQGGRTAINVPTIRWISQQSEQTLVGRGVEFRSSMNMLMFNEDYDIKVALVRTLLQDIKIAPTAARQPDETLKVVNEAVQEYVALAVGTTVIRQQIKSGRENWTSEDIRDSLKPSALTMIVDMLEHDTGAIKQVVLNTVGWKNLRASAVGVAVVGEASEAA